jgi:hypothetical protein
MVTKSQTQRSQPENALESNQSKNCSEGSESHWRRDIMFSMEVSIYA